MAIDTEPAAIRVRHSMSHTGVLDMHDVIDYLDGGRVQQSKNQLFMAYSMSPFLPQVEEKRPYSKLGH